MNENEHQELEPQWLDELPGPIKKHRRIDKEKALCKQNPNKWLVIDTDCNRPQLRSYHSQINADYKFRLSQRTINGTMHVYLRYDE